MRSFHYFISTLLALFSLSIHSQNLSDNYHFKKINRSGESILRISSDDVLNINPDLTFNYQLEAKNNLQANGKWQKQDNILVFEYQNPTDTIRYYQIVECSDSLLIIQENNIQFHFSRDLYVANISDEDNSAAAGLSKYDFKKDGQIQMSHLLKGLLGLFVLIFLTFLMSSKRRSVNWLIVAKGLILQITLAILVLKVPIVERLFDKIGKVFVGILNFTQEGSEFLFGDLMNVNSYGFIFAFQVLPTVIFFSAITSLLYYYGILQKVVWAFAWLMKKTLKLSGAESLAAAGNIFLGQTEAPLLIKPYIKSMTLSELMCLMSGGMATIAGAVLAAYIGFLGGNDPEVQLFFAKHLLTASVMSAPAAVVAAKILFPETEKVNEDMSISKGDIGANWLEAIANGTTQGLKLAVNVGAMLLVFTALMAMANSILGDLIGDWFGLNNWVNELTDGRYTQFSMEFILGYSLAPLTWLMGVASEDIAVVGQLLGEKTILNEFYAYTTMSDYIQSGSFSSSRSVIIATYILCGFANFASIGIQIGGIGVLAPSRRSDLSRLGIRALIGGTLASLYTAVIVGMLI